MTGHQKYIQFSGLTREKPEENLDLFKQLFSIKPVKGDKN